MRRISLLREEIGAWRDIEKKVEDALGLASMALEEPDETISNELEHEKEKLQRLLERMEFRLIFSGEYDHHSAIFSIHAGAGGTESQDWALMLLRMYIRYCEQNGYHTEILDQMPGEEAGMKSVTFSVEGEYAYGYLKAERGVHRLVRISPFDAASRRHTSFALVEVLPEIENDVALEIDPGDLEIDVYKSSGAGGQNVQKNSTAIRIRHIPSGLVVTCQNERSQTQNREVAMKILRSRLFEIERKRKEEEQARLKGVHVDAGWGNQIRSYVLHPYKMVKDHRTGYEIGNADDVLNGNIGGFIEAYLRSQVTA
jgi:peptide chain release factor 2